MHLDAELPNPLANNFELNNVKKGIDRELGTPPKQMLPITCDILLRVKGLLDLSSPPDMSFWACCILGFFGFLRKATLLPMSSTDPGSDCLLIRDLVWINTQFFELRVRKTKTIQCGERLLILPYCASPANPLCPVIAANLLGRASSKNLDHPLFSYKTANGVKWWTHNSFVARLRDLLARLGLDPKSYSGHSFRRGGASLGFKLGMSILQIKQRGDWRSAAVEQYIFIDKSQERIVAQKLIFGVRELL